MIVFLLQLIIILTQTLSLLLFIYVILTWILSPFHPIRQAFARMFEPLLAPIRQMLPQTGMLDLSVLVLFIILMLVQSVVQSTLNAL